LTNEIKSLLREKLHTIKDATNHNYRFKVSCQKEEQRLLYLNVGNDKVLFQNTYGSFELKPNEAIIGADFIYTILAFSTEFLNALMINNQSITLPIDILSKVKDIQS
jgi:hypothetical protein